MSSKTKEQVEYVSSMLNDFGFNYNEFSELMCREHRTLQQNFTRLCLNWLYTCSTDEYRYDGRNEASHEIAKEIFENKDSDFIGLPYI